MIPRFLLVTSCVVLLFGVGSPQAVPIIHNNSFEAHPSPLWPGLCPILGWFKSDSRAGINPCLIAPGFDEYRQTFSTNVFSNNGRIPHGTNVAFIWSQGIISQTVSNFVGGKNYAVKFFYNARAGYDPAVLYVTLGGQELISGMIVDPVTAPGDYEVPYRRAMSAGFSPTVSGDYDLVLENRTPLDGSMLFDQIEVLELGLLRLISATRDSMNPIRVTVEFSDPVDPALATDPENYFLADRDEPFFAARLISPKVVELDTPYISRNGPPPILKAIWITDLEGKGMISEHSQVQITVDPPSPVRLEIQSTESEIRVSWKSGPESNGFYLYRGNDFLETNWEDLSFEISEGDGYFFYTQLVESGAAFFQLRGPGPD